MLPHPLTNFEIQKYHQNEPKFNVVYSWKRFPEIKYGTYVINPDDSVSIGIHWIVLYVNDNNVTYFDSIVAEHIPKEIKKFIGNKNMMANIYRIQAYDSIICEYFCIVFIGFMLKRNSLLHYKNLFSPNDYQKNDKII